MNIVVKVEFSPLGLSFVVVAVYHLEILLLVVFDVSCDGFKHFTSHFTDRCG